MVRLPYSVIQITLQYKVYGLFLLVKRSNKLLIGARTACPRGRSGVFARTSCPRSYPCLRYAISPNFRAFHRLQEHAILLYATGWDTSMEQLGEMIHRWEIWRRTLRRRFSRAEWLRHAFHLPVSEHTESEPGILLIQIDGLAFRQLERALADGRMPFLRRLLRRENYRLIPFYSGIPSTTPAVQGELYYGVRCAVPAFGFLDRATDYLGSMYETTVVKGVQYQLEKRCKRPLLEGGSSWSNMYSGGAAPEESHFCGSCLLSR